jgi:beta-glucosidase-like glycosyl hydrolase
VAAAALGIQGQGVIATPRHYPENNQEEQRQTINVQRR